MNCFKNRKIYFLSLFLIMLFSCQKKQNVNENIASEQSTNEYIYSFSKEEISPLSVYRFEPGEYYMLDYPVNIRKEPNLNGEIIGKLGMNSKVNVISPVYDEKVLVIGAVWSLWYKIEYENITGYIWGGYISVRTLVYDIDNNGVDDYFHFRISQIHGHRYYVDVYNDVVIYLNNKKLPAMNVSLLNPEKGYRQEDWGDCYFEPTEKHTVLIKLSFGSDGYYAKDIYEMDATGKIELKEQIIEEGDEE